VVVKGTGPTLLGRNWLGKLKLNWSKLTCNNVLSLSSPLDQLLQKHDTLFRSELGRFIDSSVQLPIDSQAKPRFFKSRTVPYALKKKSFRGT
jgi:hypothetical protein